ncbi:type 1 glutamine amidotransferase [bacterium]|nr:type 1 glutamine amidotransferase [bacterium]
MRRVLVLQHVAHEILGTLNPLMKVRGLKIKYVNFDRNPDARPSLDKYSGLIVLGGYMGAYETKKHPHLLHEMRLIEEAYKRNIPVLGICLGSQLMAKVLGADVRKTSVPEVGWRKLNFLPEVLKDPLFKNFEKTESLFQLHQDAFDHPTGTIPLASSDMFPNQGFKYGEKAYGFQFHLEVDHLMVQRWLRVPANQSLIERHNDIYSIPQILKETEEKIERSLQLSERCFNSFLDLFGEFKRVELLGSGHKIKG